MEHRAIDIYAATAAEAERIATAQAERAGFYVLRRRAEQIGGDPFTDLRLKYRVTLEGHTDAIWCPLAGSLKDVGECVTGCASPEQKVVCQMEMRR